MSTENPVTHYVIKILSCGAAVEVSHVRADGTSMVMAVSFPRAGVTKKWIASLPVPVRFVSEAGQPVDFVLE